MEASAHRQLMKRLITENRCSGENKIISCQAIQTLRTAIDALTMLMGILSFLATVLPLLRALTRLFTWLMRIVAWLKRISNRIGAVEKYLKTIAPAIVALGEFFDCLAKLCEESPLVPRPDTSALYHDIPELIAELSVITENGRKRMINKILFRFRLKFQERLKIDEYLNGKRNIFTYAVRHGERTRGRVVPGRQKSIW